MNNNVKLKQIVQCIMVDWDDDTRRLGCSKTSKHFTCMILTVVNTIEAWMCVGKKNGLELCSMGN